LTDAQRQKIEDFFADQAAMYAREGEDPPDCASVTFTWVAGLGRSITASINDSKEYEIE